MKIEAVHQLATSVHSSPKLFACLLGSGVSRAAGIPTGWQIVLDLVRKHAAQVGAADTPDPALWYLDRYGVAPDYSEVVSKLAPTTELRRNLIEPYFTVQEAATGERREHEPTTAHRSIAQLVRRGLLRVIITTNFDRLMENALREAGVASVEVVSSDEEAANCYPFHACEAFVFKIHGDWKDTRLRNSMEELAAYPRGIAELLARILGEHGLIVCGWSAEYDLALRTAAAGFQRRFPVYWVDPNLGESAGKLVAHLHGTHVEASGDRFFEELNFATEVIERRSPPTDLTADVLVLRARRMIEQKQDMALDDLVDEATHALCAWIDARSESAPGNAEEEREQTATAEQHAEPLARLLARLAWHGTDVRRAQHGLSRLLVAAANRRPTLPGGDPFAVYPVVIAAYAWGIACAARGDWRAAILGVRDARSDVKVALVVPPGGNARLHRFGSFKYAPEAEWGDHFAQYLYRMLERFVATRGEFERLYDRFDVLVAILAQRHDEAWIPRCFCKSDVAGEVTGAADVFEDWFLAAALRAMDAREPHDLLEVFYDQHKEPMVIIEELRQLAAEQRVRWRHP